MRAPYVEARPKGGARAEKEISGKAQKIMRYQIVSTYFLDVAFKVLSSVVFWFESVYLRAILNILKTFTYYMLCGYKKEKRQAFGVFSYFVSGFAIL